jgi:hypothetical protein
MNRQYKRQPYEKSISFDNEDDIVPYFRAVRFHDSLDKAGIPNKLSTVHGAKHDGFNRQALVNSFTEI